MSIRSRLFLAVVLLAATAGSSAFAQPMGPYLQSAAPGYYEPGYYDVAPAYYDVGPYYDAAPGYFAGNAFDLYPGQTGGGSLGYNYQVEKDY